MAICSTARARLGFAGGLVQLGHDLIHHLVDIGQPIGRAGELLTGDDDIALGTAIGFQFEAVDALLAVDLAAAIAAAKNPQAAAADGDLRVAVRALDQLLGCRRQFTSFGIAAVIDIKSADITVIQIIADAIAARALIG